jgi:hypothetical protein
LATLSEGDILLFIRVFLKILRLWNYFFLYVYSQENLKIERNNIIDTPAILQIGPRVPEIGLKYMEDDNIYWTFVLYGNDPFCGEDPFSSDFVQAQDVLGQALQYLARPVCLS